jgi:hypothetical protein
MKKVLIFSLSLFFGATTFAQSLEDIGKMYNTKKYAAAKVAIDKFIADPKNASSTEGLYYKGKIYNEISKDSTTPKADAYDYKLVAFDAFKKMQVTDKIDFRMKSEQYLPYLDLYGGMYDLGINQFNNKQYAGAYKAFSKALELEDFLIERKYTYEGFKANKLDTALLLNTASAALQAHDTASGIAIYRKITDAGVVSKDYENVYEFLVSYYNSKKDVANFQTMLAKAKAAYPTNAYWNELELASLSEGGDKKAMFAKYEDLFTKEPNNFVNSYNYAIELYNSIYVKDYKSIDSNSSKKLIQVLKAAVQNDKDNAANMLLTNHLFNVAADYSQQASLIKEGKLAKPADIKKKKDLNAMATLKMDEVIPYAQKSLTYFSALPTLKSNQKVNYRLAAGYLSDIYKAKGNVKKAAEYDKISNDIKF